MKKRLIEYLAHLGIGQNKFEKNAGLSIGFINKLTGNMTIKTLDKISSEYPDLNINWLKTGEGDMIKSVVNQNNVNGDNIQGNNVSVNKSQTDHFIDLLRAKDKQIDKSQAQIDRSQVQIDRLIGLIEKLNNI